METDIRTVDSQYIRFVQSEENHPLQSDNRLEDNSIHHEDIRNMDSEDMDTDTADIHNMDNSFRGFEILGMLENLCSH